MKNYKFTCVPKNLMLAMDGNCKVMLFTLVQYSDYTAGEDGWFYAPNTTLQQQAGLSKNLVIATLDTLYNAGVIDIECIGVGTGRKSNRIKVNTSLFDKYDEYKVEDILGNPELQIRTVQYKNNYSPSYLPESKKECKEVCKKVNTIIDNVDNINNKENINNLSIDITTKELKEKENKITEVIDKPIKEHRDTNRPGLGQVYMDDDLFKNLPDDERKLQLEYYYVLKDLPILERKKTGLDEDCYLPQTLEWLDDKNIYQLINCLVTWNDGGRGTLAQLTDGLTPTVKKEIITYLVLYCKSLDSRCEGVPAYQQVYV